jgi:hypothetical protein
MQKCKTRRRWASRVAIFDITKKHYHFMGSPSTAEYQNVPCYVHKTVHDMPFPQEWQRRIYGLRDYRQSSHNISNVS